MLFASIALALFIVPFALLAWVLGHLDAPDAHAVAAPAIGRTRDPGPGMIYYDTYLYSYLHHPDERGHTRAQVDGAHTFDATTPATYDDGANVV